MSPKESAVPENWVFDERTHLLDPQGWWAVCWDVGDALLTRGLQLQQVRSTGWSGATVGAVGGCDEDGDLHVPLPETVAETLDAVDELIGHRARQFLVTVAGAVHARSTEDMPFDRWLDESPRPVQDKVGYPYDFGDNAGNRVTFALRRALRRAGRGYWAGDLWDTALRETVLMTDDAVLADGVVALETFDLVAGAVEFRSCLPGWFTPPSTRPPTEIGVAKIFAAYLNGVAGGATDVMEAYDITRALQLWECRGQAAWTGLVVAQQVVEQVAAADYRDPLLTRFPLYERGEIIASMAPFSDRLLDDDEIVGFVDSVRAAEPGMASFAPDPRALDADHAMGDVDPAPVWSTAAVLVEWAAAATRVPAPVVAADALAAARPFLVL